MTTPILEARDLSKRFPGPKKLFTPARFVTAVDRVSLSVMPGETLAIVGESGSGKSVTAMSTIDLVDEPGRIVSGTITFDGRDVLSLNHKNLERLRGEGISMIFQEPGSVPCSG